MSGTTHINAGLYASDPWSFTDSTGNYNDDSGTISDNIDTAPLKITAANQTKIYGDTLIFDEDSPSSDFSVSGLIAGESIDSVDLVSAGAAPGATVVGSPYDITFNSSGTIASMDTDLDNYDITYCKGKLYVTPREGFTAYIGQTLFVTSGTSSTTAQVMLTASIQDPDGSGSVAAATVTFKNLLTGKILAANVPVALVQNTDTSIGTANVIVTLSTGQYGADSYLIEVSLGSSYTNTQQTGASPGSDPYEAAHALVTVMQPSVTNTMKGAGTIPYLSSSAGLFRSDTMSDATYMFGLKYNKGGTNPQGKILLMIPRSDAMYYVKSNSIISMAVKLGSSVNTATVYTKATVYKILGDGSSMTIDGNVTLRMDVADGKTYSTDQVGFTVLSSKTSTLYFSNNWVYDSATKSWRTVLQNVLGGVCAAVIA
jgi:hypothetical protein